MSLEDKLYKILIQGGSWKTILGGRRDSYEISRAGSGRTSGADAGRRGRHRGKY